MNNLPRNAPIPGDDLRNLTVQLALVLSPVLLPVNPNDRLRLGILTTQLSETLNTLITDLLPRSNLTLAEVQAAGDALCRDLAAAYEVPVEGLLTPDMRLRVCRLLLRVLRCCSVLPDMDYLALKGELLTWQALPQLTNH